MENNTHVENVDLRLFEALRDLQLAMRQSGFGPDGTLYAYEIDGTASVIINAVNSLAYQRKMEGRNDAK